MNYFNRYLLAGTITLAGLLAGCASENARRVFRLERDSAGPPNVSLKQQPQYASNSLSVVEEPFSNTIDPAFLQRPVTDESNLPDERKSISLDEAIRQALYDRKILVDLGGRLVSSPESVGDVYGPALQAVDPNFGIQAALSDFDARFRGGANLQKNDNVFNNPILGGGLQEVKQDLTSSYWGLTKTAATGAQWSLQGNLQHDNNNAPNNLFNHSWTGLWEAQVRQPLAQGSGVLFNRIAGPNARPGLQFSNGVLISQANYEISSAQFERNVRDYVSQVVTAYWNLALAYEQFQATKLGRDTALTTWNTIRARFEQGLPGGEADREAQAREQYFQFQTQLVTALAGDRLTGQTGVLQSESELRRLLGLPQNDGALLVPADAPAGTEVIHDWEKLAMDALNRRAELREQATRIQRRQMEAIAARNFLMPRVDLVGTYRNNGFGDDLLGGGSGRFSSALKDSWSGDHDEFEFGLQFETPVGFRKASAGVRFADLNLAREKAVYAEQQKQILHQLGSAVRQLRQSANHAELAYNRLRATIDTVQARQAAFDAGSASFDELLEAQRRQYEAQIAWHRAITNTELAERDVTLESGRFLDQFGVLLGVGSSPGDPVILARKPSRSSQATDYRIAEK